MKNIPQISVLTFIILCTLHAAAQVKPRYVKTPITICPIDYSSLNTSDGLRYTTNQKSLAITLDKAVNVPIESDLKIGSVELKKGTLAIINKSDTSFLISKVVEKPLAFNVVETIGSYSIIKFWSIKGSDNSNTITPIQSLQSATINKLPRTFDLFTTTNAKQKGFNDTPSATVNDYEGYYLVKTDDIEKKTKEFEYKYRQWNIGLMVIPVKLRPFATKSGQFDFNASYSLGPTFSYTMRHRWQNDFTTNLLLYPGVSSIAVSKDILNNGDTTTKNIAAFSPAIGLMWEKSSVQVSLMLGMDFPAGGVQKTWVYRNMPWIGLGISFSLFKIQTSGGTQSGKNDTP